MDWFNWRILISGAFVIVGVVVWRITKGWSRTSFWGPSYSIYKISINENESSGSTFEICAREIGLVSWILNKFNFEMDMKFYADNEGYYTYHKTLLSMLKEFTPYTQIAGTSCGYSRNIMALRFALLSILAMLNSIILTGLSMYTLFIMMIMFGFIINYIFSKRIVILVESSGSLPVWVRFSEGILDNVKIELADIEKVTNILNKNIARSGLLNSLGRSKDYKNNEMFNNVQKQVIIHNESNLKKRKQDNIIEDLSHNIVNHEEPPVTIAKITATFKSNGSPKEIIFYQNDKQIAQEMCEELTENISRTGFIPDGPVMRYYKNGDIERVCYYQNNKREGISKWYYKNGKLKSELTYKDDKINGTYKSYYSFGGLKEECDYKDGKKDGYYRNYNENGVLESESIWSNDVLIKSED